jgi:hypothetical protein
MSKKVFLVMKVMKATIIIVFSYNKDVKPSNAPWFNPMPKIIMEKSKVASHFTMKKMKSMKILLVYSHDRSTSCTSIEIQL